MENTLLFLMDMDGHDGLSDDFANRYRRYALQDIINDPFLDREKNVIVSTHIYHQTSKDLHHQATWDKGWKWYFVEKDRPFATFEKTLRKEGFILDQNNTNIIFGGTNTSGCVLHSSNLSMSQFLGRGYDCQLYLPLCDDVMIPGICSHDKSQKAFCELYDFIKRNKYWEKLDILTRFVDLKLIRSAKKFTYKST